MFLRIYGIYAFEYASRHIHGILLDFSDFSEKYKYSYLAESYTVIIMANKRECCKIDAVVTMDAKGQIVLPKDLREKAKLNPGAKLALIGFERDGDVCCISIIKADTLSGTVKTMLGPILNEALK